jgi:hypothetical protein
MTAMTVLTATRPRHAVPLRTIVAGLLLGATFVAGGLAVGYLILGTGLLGGFVAARPTAEQTVTGVIAWTFALVAPGVFLIVGLARLADTLALASFRRRRPRPAAAIARSLPPDHVVAPRVRLPDGRVVPEIVFGPFGAAVIEELPPPGAARESGGRWEVRVGKNRWAPLENPLDRAERDAERVRRWLNADERDHVVKVYAAVVGRPIPRTPGCAVTTPGDLAAWIASLPPQRSLNEDRLSAIVDLARTAVT